VVSGRVGTRAEHFLAHISNVINVLDRNNMKGNHLVTDNASIHTAFKIRELVESRGEKYLYFPTWSPFLIPLKNFGFGQK
jgi:transposase